MSTTITGIENNKEGKLFVMIQSRTQGIIRVRPSQLKLVTDKSVISC